MERSLCNRAAVKFYDFPALLWDCISKAVSEEGKEKPFCLNTGVGKSPKFKYCSVIANVRSASRFRTIEHVSH
jgi:hypothetical protein